MYICLFVRPGVFDMTAIFCDSDFDFSKRTPRVLIFIKTYFEEGRDEPDHPAETNSKTVPTNNKKFIIFFLIIKRPGSLP